MRFTQGQNKIYASFSGETLDGVPHGLGFISFKVSGSETSHQCFRGMGVFTQGELHNGPALFMTGSGLKLSYSSMHHGRPYGIAKQYRPEGQTVKYSTC